MPDTSTTSGAPCTATASRVASARVNAAPRIRQRQNAPGWDTGTTSWRLCLTKPLAHAPWEPPWNGSTSRTRATMNRPL